jgi:hypothetical protein
VTPGAAARTNAAQAYRQAFELLSSLSETELAMLKNREGGTDPGAVAELHRKLRPILDLARSGASITNCDWELSGLTLETPLPHLAQARTLSNALLWDAVHGENMDAGNDILAAMALGDHVSSFLIGYLVNTSIQNNVISILSSQGARIPAKTLDRIAERLAPGPHEASWHRAILDEAQLVSRTGDHCVGMTLEQAQSFMRQSLDDSSPLLRSPQDLIEACRTVAVLEHDYAEALFAADPALKHAWLDKMRAAEQAMPLIASILPAFSALEEKAQAMVVKRAMTVAGLALLQGVPDALERHPDPWTGQPFGHQATSTGFELWSGLEQDGQPVMLEFRNR